MLEIQGVRKKAPLIFSVIPTKSTFFSGTLYTFMCIHLCVFTVYCASMFAQLFNNYEKNINIFCTVVKDLSNSIKIAH